MTTILIFNAASGLIAAAGLTGLVAWRRRAPQVRLAYITPRR